MAVAYDRTTEFCSSLDVKKWVLRRSLRSTAQRPWPHCAVPDDTLPADPVFAGLVWLLCPLLVFPTVVTETCIIPCTCFTYRLPSLPLCEPVGAGTPVVLLTPATPVWHRETILRMWLE